MDKDGPTASVLRLGLLIQVGYPGHTTFREIKLERLWSPRLWYNSSITLSVDQIIESIAHLPAAEQERIRQWLEEKGATNREGQGSQAHANRSVRSLSWLHEDREKYSGQWVALDGDRLIARGLAAKEVYSKAKAEGVEIPFVELVTQEESGPFTGGWLS